MRSVLVLENEDTLRATYAAALGKLRDVRVDQAGTLRDAVMRLDQGVYDAIVSDIDLPDGLGVQMLGELSKRRAPTRIVFVTAYHAAYGSLVPEHSGVQVLDKPITLEKLRQVVESLLTRTEESPFSLADYVQLSCMGRHTTRIELSRGGTVRGRIMVVQGQLWSAEDGDRRGEEAFRALLFAEGLSVVCHRTTEAEAGPANITRPWEGVLMDAARLHDEGTRGKGGGAPEVAPSEFDLGVSVTPAPLAPGAATAPAAPAPAPVAETPAPPAAAPPVVETPASDGFEDVYDEAMTAMMKKAYPAAIDALVRARRIRPSDANVRANLERLRQMGHDIPPQ